MPEGGTIIVVADSVETISLTAGLEISKGLTIEGNGVTIRQQPNLALSSILGINSDSGTVTVRRTRFTNSGIYGSNTGISGSGGAIKVSGNGNVNLETCIFSNNSVNRPGAPYYGDKAPGGAIYQSGTGTLNVKGCTFYRNSSNGNGAGNTGGAIYVAAGGTLTLEGNLFDRNTGLFPVVEAASSATVTSLGYNVVDVPLGTAEGQSGWAAHSTDKTTGSRETVNAEDFKPYIEVGAENALTTRPASYPEVDFYGEPIPASNAAAGAVQDTSILFYTVTFNTILGTAPAPASVQYNRAGSSPGSQSPGRDDIDFDYWYLAGEDSAFDFATLITRNITLKARWAAKLAIGDTGPGGGTIFYFNPDGFTVRAGGALGSRGPLAGRPGSDAYTAFYLEVSPTPYSSPWTKADAGRNVDITSLETGIGEGRRNTATIYSSEWSYTSVSSSFAAQVCLSLSEGGFSDWFLPSVEEASQLSNVFTNGSYWTSNQSSAAYARIVYFGTGTVPNGLKTTSNSYRAVRAF